MDLYDNTDSRYMEDLQRTAPAMVDGFFAFNRSVFGVVGTLEPKVKELIAVAVANTTQCATCISVHSKAAKDAGASDAEIGEAVMLAAALRAASAVAHGWLTMKAISKD